MHTIVANDFVLYISVGSLPTMMHDWLKFASVKWYIDKK